MFISETFDEFDYTQLSLDNSVYDENTRNNDKYKSYLGFVLGPRTRRDVIVGAFDECCNKACSYQMLMSFCG